MQRGESVDSVVTVIGKEEWDRRLKEDNGAICLVLGLYGDKKETGRILKLTKMFLTQCWERRCLNKSMEKD